MKKAHENPGIISLPGFLLKKHQPVLKSGGICIIMVKMLKKIYIGDNKCRQ